MAKKDCFYAKLSFFLGFGFWIPLLNIPLSVFAIIIGISALRLVHIDQERYGGRTYAIIGILLGGTAIILLASMLLLPESRQRLMSEFLNQTACNCPPTG